jgi:hypothetical protein
LNFAQVHARAEEGPLIARMWLRLVFAALALILLAAAIELLRGQANADPWVDVKSGTNGCAAASGNGSPGDAVAINCQVAWVHSHGGGIVWFPCGDYDVSGRGVTITQGVRFSAPNRACVAIHDSNDETAVTMTADTSAQSYVGLDHIWVYCLQNSSATQACVNVTQGVAFLHECGIWGGKYALEEQGTDGAISECFISSWGSGGASLWSNSGANRYFGDKFDLNGQNQDTCVLITTSGSGVNENHFTNIDCSGGNGGFYKESFVISDNGSNGAIVGIGEQSILSAPFSIIRAKYVMFNGDEMPSGTTATAAPTVIVGSIAGDLTVSGASISCAANFGITCLQAPASKEPNTEDTRRSHDQANAKQTGTGAENGTDARD